jgi:hypothetical protein
VELCHDDDKMEGVKMHGLLSIRPCTSGCGTRELQRTAGLDFAHSPLQHGELEREFRALAWLGGDKYRSTKGLEFRLDGREPNATT